jgi:hypothetical protein
VRYFIDKPAFSYLASVDPMNSLKIEKVQLKSDASSKDYFQIKVAVERDKKKDLRRHYIAVSIVEFQRFL